MNYVDISGNRRLESMDADRHGVMHRPNKRVDTSGHSDSARAQQQAQEQARREQEKQAALARKAGGGSGSNSSGGGSSSNSMGGNLIHNPYPIGPAMITQDEYVCLGAAYRLQQEQELLDEGDDGDEQDKEVEYPEDFLELVERRENIQDALNEAQLSQEQYEEEIDLLNDANDLARKQRDKINSEDIDWMSVAGFVCDAVVVIVAIAGAAETGGTSLMLLTAVDAETYFSLVDNAINAADVDTGNRKDQNQIIRKNNKEIKALDYLINGPTGTENIISTAEYNLSWIDNEIDKKYPEYGQRYFIDDLMLTNQGGIFSTP